MKSKFVLIFVFVILTFLFVQTSVVEETYSLFKVTKDVSGSISVPEHNYCISNGFTKLSDCMLVMENYSSSVSAAKTYISNKGTATYTSIAPTNTYVETSKEVVADEEIEFVIRTSSHFTLAKSFKFNNTTGRYFLGEYNSNGEFEEVYVNDVLDDSYINYYTCGSTEGTYESCSNLYQIKEYEIFVDGATTYYNVTKAIKHSFEVAESFDSEVGLYSTADDLGTSYFYRGNVQNNYVSYAGFIWRIIRQNGDGSVRMIYSGTSADSTGMDCSVGSTSFNIKSHDPVYVGYMYTESFSLSDNDDKTFQFVRFKQNTSYYFAKNYEFDSTNKVFKLKGAMTYGTWAEKYNDVISTYPYTCFSSEVDGTCDFIIQPVAYVNDYTMKVKIYSYSSVNATDILVPKTNATIKDVVDTWYEENIKDKKDSNSKLYSDYLTDNIFCNDRSLQSGDGFVLSKSSYYTPYSRVNSTPSLLCKQDIDKFSTTSSYGNAALKYPIGLITADEASMAGAKLTNANSNFYLYTGTAFWTMTPSYFGGTYVYSRMWAVNQSGEIYRTYALSNVYGTRPVVNLSKNVIIKSGDGSADDPYIVSLS